MPNNSYKPEAYWRETLGGRFDESGVAYPWLPVGFNAALYTAARRNVARALEAIGVDVSGKSVLDIGCGTGIWLDEWRSRGASSLAGVDIAPAAVQLEARFPGTEIAIGDISAAQPFARRFDFISAMSVLLHIPSDDAFLRALRNIAAMLAPDGRLVVIDPYIRHTRRVPEDGNSRLRTAAEWDAALYEAGLELVAVAPAAVVFANPIESSTAVEFRALQALWRIVERAAARHPGLPWNWFATLDAALVRTGWAPTAKVLVIRQRAAATDS